MSFEVDNNINESIASPNSSLAHTFVSSRFSEATNYADTAWSAAQDFLYQLSHQSLVSVDPNVWLSTPDNSINSSLSAGTEPAPPTLSLDTSGAPASPTLPALDEVTISWPSFDVNDVNLSSFVPPTTIDPDPPGDSPTVQYPDLPTAPSLTLPNAPDLPDISLPTAPLLDVPTFDGTDPEAGLTLTPPSDLFLYNEEEYSSALKDAVYDKIKTDMLTLQASGADGLGSDVEQALWDRGRSRLEDELDRTHQDLAAQWAARGFPMPPGMLAAQQAQQQVEHNKRLTDLDRDITTEQARLAQQKAEFTVQQGLNLEKMLIDHTNAVNQRAFEAARSVAEYALAEYDARVKTYQARIQKLAQDVAVFNAEVQKANLDLELFRSEIQKAQVEASTWESYIALYNAKLEKVKTAHATYQTQVEAANVAAQIEKVKIEEFAERVRAYGAQVQANASKYEGYKILKDAESLNVQNFAEQVRAYQAQVEAKQSEAAQKATMLELKQRENQAALDQYSADIQKYSAEVQARASEIDAQVRVFGMQTENFRSRVQAESARVDAEVGAYQAEVQYLQAEASVALQNAQISLENAKSQNELTVQNMQAGSQVASQLAASALTSVSATASYGYTGSESEQVSMSHSVSRTDQYSQSSSTSESTQTIISGQV